MGWLFFGTYLAWWSTLTMLKLIFWEGRGWNHQSVHQFIGKAWKILRRADGPMRLSRLRFTRLGVSWQVVAGWIHWNRRINTYPFSGPFFSWSMWTYSGWASEIRYTTKRMVETLYKWWDVYHRFQLVIRISSTVCGHDIFNHWPIILGWVIIWWFQIPSGKRLQKTMENHHF